MDPLTNEASQVCTHIPSEESWLWEAGPLRKTTPESFVSYLKMFLMSCGELNLKVYIYVAQSLLNHHGNWGSTLEVSGRQRDLDEPWKCGGRDTEMEGVVRVNGSRWRKVKMKWSEVKFGCYEKFVFSFFFYLNFIYFHPSGKTIYNRSGLSSSPISHLQTWVFFPLFSSLKTHFKSKFQIKLKSLPPTCSPKWKSGSNRSQGKP